MGKEGKKLRKKGKNGKWKKNKEKWYWLHIL